MVIELMGAKATFSYVVLKKCQKLKDDKVVS
jgi:hypothetical protein